MFRKRQKKHFPEGTFIPTPARICAIIQLCLAFTVLLWNLSEPFAGELFAVKSHLLLYQDVMGIPSHEAISTEKQARLAQNAALFQELPAKQRQPLTAAMQAIQTELQRSFFDKLTRAMHILAFEMPPFEQAWLLFSLLIPILLLKRVEGASAAVWLLPLLTACYALDNRMYGVPHAPHGEAHLYPSEKILIEEYLNAPLSPDIFTQQAELQQAWQLYLIKAWTKQTPSQDPDIFKSQAAQGEFAFNVMRLQQRPPVKTQPTKPHNDKSQEPLWLLAFYLFWNTYFAYTAWKLNASEPKVEKQTT